MAEETPTIEVINEVPEVEVIIETPTVDIIDFCGSCHSTEGFIDLPIDYAEKRWPEAHHFHGQQRTQCKACGATFNVYAIHEDVREKVSD